MTGTIVKAISGFYYLLPDDAGCDSDAVIECKARGVFKSKGITPLVGDRAEFDRDEKIVTKILPRINSFDRPPAANVETLVIVMAAADPDPSFEILDRFILAAEKLETEIILCVNKCDIAGEEILESFRNIYEPIYPLYFVCGTDGTGVDKLRDALKGKTAALAGPSGAGKSTLTNLLLGRKESETGEISKKSMRGKNTTRHTQLFTGEGFRIFDTPGFTSFEANLDDETELEKMFPEFRPYLGLCRFDDCRHLKEPDCAITAALKDGNISQSRYNSYTDLYKTIIDNKRYK